LMGGGLPPSSTRQSRLCSNRGWRQDPMPDLFQIDERGAVNVAMPDLWSDGHLLIH
jgi:hypothetical protein